MINRHRVWTNMGIWGPGQDSRSGGRLVVVHSGPWPKELTDIATGDGRPSTVGCIVMTEAQSPGLVAMQWLIDDVKQRGLGPGFWPSGPRRPPLRPDGTCCDFDHDTRPCPPASAIFFFIYIQFCLYSTPVPCRCGHPNAGRAGPCVV